MNAYLLGHIVGASSVGAGRWTIEATDLVERIEPVTRVDWGDFLFFDSPEYRDLSAREDRLVNAMARAAFTVRVVDNGYFYIYSCSDIDLGALRIRLRSDSYEEGILEGLPFPF